MQAALKAQINKTDRNDARGIAQMMRVGLYRPVHVKTLLPMLLTHRQLLQSKAIAIENDLRGTLRNFGLKRSAGPAHRAECGYLIQPSGAGLFARDETRLVPPTARYHSMAGRRKAGGCAWMATAHGHMALSRLALSACLRPEGSSRKGTSLSS